MSELSRLAEKVAAHQKEIMVESVRRAVWASALVHLLIQTVVVLLLLFAIFQQVQVMQQRADRNLAFHSCILSIHPDARNNDDIAHCYKKANNLYPGLEPHLPRPVFPTLDVEIRE